jgi:hypothetical protein
VLIHLTAERGYVVELHAGKGTGAASWCTDRSGDHLRITAVRPIAIVPLWLLLTKIPDEPQVRST